MVKSRKYNRNKTKKRVTKKNAAVLFEGGNWDKLITFQINDLDLVWKFYFTLFDKFFY